MDQSLFYSIRMRATAGNQHVSGAERIVSSKMIVDTVQSLVTRARGKKFTPEQIVIKIENLGTTPIRPLTALDVITLNAPDITMGRAGASRILQSLDISERAVLAAINHLCSGAAPSGRNMRGAMIIDAQNGKRLEPDQERGIRASRFDWTDEALESITRKLAEIGLKHYRTHEALALATKVAHAPGIVAELCWSDEPDYTAGYVASRKIGYVRFPVLKLNGDSRGGRAFFVNRNDLDLCRFINYLQTEVVFIADSGDCKPAIEPDDYFYTLNGRLVFNRVTD
jgi:6-carboxyhexanoate--CoA ligase